MTAPALVSPDQVSAYTQGKVSASDPRLADLIGGASAAVRRYCRWHVAPVVTETLVLDGPGGDLLCLPTLRLAAVASIAELGVTLTDGLDFEWSANGEIRRHGRWSSHFRSVAATIDHGFDEAPDVAQIIVQVVAQALSSPMGATREQAGALAVSWATTAPGVSGGVSLLARDLAVIDQYRLP